MAIEMIYYKVPIDKIESVLDLMEHSGWEWTDGSDISKYRDSAMRHCGNEFSVFRVDYSIGKDSGKQYKRISQNPDYNHKFEEHPDLREYKELDDLIRADINKSV